MSARARADASAAVASPAFSSLLAAAPASRICAPCRAERRSPACPPGQRHLRREIGDVGGDGDIDGGHLPSRQTLNERFSSTSPSPQAFSISAISPPNPPSVTFPPAPLPPVPPVVLLSSPDSAPVPSWPRGLRAPVVGRHREKRPAAPRKEKIPAAGCRGFYSGHSD